ncbi:hypothetical protein N4285_01655 [Staphylococcus aureus]|uniref:hypothetical protein n=1 Tax=Staphylococcus aureus TaxID=1280 RepID=UPI0021B13D3F|nr:hypothetical protein [Staphylococcus aureus]MCT6684968.1 hypothetical protein [Staphylococcus aureus]
MWPFYFYTIIRTLSIISIFLIILYFLIYRVEGNFCVIILYCLLPLFVNTSLYILYVIIFRYFKK